MDRLATQTNGSLAIMKLAAEMLLVLPGNPIIYYGEELGMFGSKASGPDIWDETRRMPFLWGDEYTTDWIVSTNQTLINIEAENAEIETASEQLADADSLLATYEAILQIRNTYPALAYGNDFVAWDGATSSLTGFYRTYSWDENDTSSSQTVLVLHNFNTDPAALPTDVNGTLVYLSGVEILDGVTEMPARSTAIFLITEG
jgi:glycosidase